MDVETIDASLLARKKRCADLSLAACRKRQSPRTGFVHYFPGLDEFSDTIPLYENFCFVSALYRQKTVESATEAKDLLERLLGFQTHDGNFPVYIHEYPRCRDRMQGLKIAPILLQLTRHFSSILSPDFKERILASIEKILKFSKDKAFGLWQFRYDMCSFGKPFLEPDLAHFSASDWAEWLISAQLGTELELPLQDLFHPNLQIFLNRYSPQIQEGTQPKPLLIEYLMAELSGRFSQRLLSDHPSQMHLAALWPISSLEDGQYLLQNSFMDESRAILWTSKSEGNADLLRIFWQRENGVHSFVLPQMGYSDISLIGKNEWEILFSLPAGVDQSQNDLFEVFFYVDYSPEIHWTVAGVRATVFSLGDVIEMQSPRCRLSLSFELTDGSGDFLGHFSQANRPAQTQLKNYAAYDWQIAVRTLRRTEHATLRAVCKVY